MTCIHALSNVSTKKKSSIYYKLTRGITPKHVTNGGEYLLVLAPGQHSSEETSQRWRAVDTVPSFTGPVIEPKPPAPIVRG